MPNRNGAVSRALSSIPPLTGVASGIRQPGPTVHLPTIWLAAVLVILAVASGACATPPKTDIAAAHAAVDRAVASKANQYAPESLKVAQNAQAKLDAELKVQDAHLPMMRSFSEAVKLADAAKAAGERAEKDAETAEQMAGAEAAALIGDAKARIQDAEDELDNAAKGRSAPADLNILGADLAAAKSTVREAETDVAGRRYPDAKSKAEAAKRMAESIVSSLERIHKTQQRRSNRGR